MRDTNESWLNCTIYEENGVAILIDCGTYPSHTKENDQIVKKLQNDPRIKACVITHGHLDHWNGLTNSMTYPVFVGDRTYVFLKKKTRSNYPNKGDFSLPHDLRVCDAQSPICVSGFKITPIGAPHSIYENRMLLIETPHGRKILHTGDFKINSMTPDGEGGLSDYLKGELKQIGDMGGVDYLYIDNLGAHRPGFTQFEQDAVDGVEQIIRQAPGRVFVSMFSSNTQRIREIVFVVEQKMGKTTEFCGSAMCLACELEFEHNQELIHNQGDVVFVGGCQGEETSTLQQIADGIHRTIALTPDDTIIFSSSAIPGNEEKVRQIVSILINRGCKVFLNQGETERIGLAGYSRNLNDEFCTHVSGHGQAEDARLVIELTKPRTVIPAIWTNPQFQAIQKIASQMGVGITIPKGHCVKL